MIPEIQVEPRVVTTPEGQVSVWIPAPTLVLSRVEGRMVLAHARAIMAEVDGVLERQHAGNMVAIHDFTGVETYEVAVQAQMTVWAVAVMPSVRRVVIGVGSPLVALAVRAANLAVGNRFEVVNSRDALVRALRAELLALRKVG